MQKHQENEMSGKNRNWNDLIPIEYYLIWIFYKKSRR
jgi:hypothetical protein